MLRLLHTLNRLTAACFNRRHVFALLAFQSHCTFVAVQHLSRFPDQIFIGYTVLDLPDTLLAFFSQYASAAFLIGLLFGERLITALVGILCLLRFAFQTAALLFLLGNVMRQAFQPFELFFQLGLFALCLGQLAVSPA